MSAGYTGWVDWTQTRGFTGFAGGEQFKTDTKKTSKKCLFRIAGKTSGHGRDPTVVAEGIVSALKAGEFHLFPDTMARDFGGAYQSYAENIIEPLPEQA